MQRTDIPANISILVPTPERIKTLKQTRVLDIFDGGNQNTFHEEGLFSVSTFGRVGSDERDVKFSFIDIKAEVIHPYVFKQLTRLKKMYLEIMAGRKHAIWDENINDFVASDAVNGYTGYNFFFSKWKDIVFKGTGSDIRDMRIKFMTKFKDMATTNKILVLPAGLRDVQIDAGGRVKEGEINEFYRTLISISNTINLGSNEVTSIIDNARFSMQLEFVKIYEYIIGLLEGKGGFIQEKWGARRVFNGTRNVITAMDTSPSVLGMNNSPKLNSTGLGLYQLMRGAMPKSKHAILTGWVSRVFNGREGTANLVNPKTLRAETVKVSSDSIDKWTTTSGIEKVLISYKESHIRLKPVMVEGYYIGLVYRDNKRFRFFSDISELPPELSKKSVFPITLCELLYISGYRMWNTLAMFSTRYPVTGVGSIYASFAYVKNTIRGNVLAELGEDWMPIGDEYIALEYPDFNDPVFMDSMVPHPSRLAGLGGDFDGDTMSATILYSDDAIEEAHTILNKASTYLNPRGGYYASPFVDTVERVLFNMTGD